jgi:hypothetical protein
MKRNIITALALLLLLVPAALSYKFSLATESIDGQALRSKLDNIPKQFKDWKQSSTVPDEEERSAFKEETYSEVTYFDSIQRYENPVTGRQVLLLIRSGSWGPLATFHHPERCYVDQGYKPFGVSLRRHLATDAFDAEFTAMDFSKETNAKPVSVRLYWAWSNNGKWSCPEEPRLHFSNAPLLHRMYVVETLELSSDKHDNDACEQFIRDAIPGINKALFGK